MVCTERAEAMELEPGGARVARSEGPPSAIASTADGGACILAALSTHAQDTEPS